MSSPRELLYHLLDYIREQAKDVDPRGYRLSATKDFLLRRDQLVGLPGVEFDLKVEGDHIWLRVRRLVVSKPPRLSEKAEGLLKVSQDPYGPLPALDEAAFLHRLGEAAKEKSPEERKEMEGRARAALAKTLESYTLLWKAWAEGERPRRKTIALYGDLFALKHQLEAEETGRPQELVWGMGVSTWKLPMDGKSFDFEYPLLTQAMEIGLDETTMALELRPRATDTQVELSAIVACQVQGAAEVDGAVRSQLQRAKGHPVTPFDASSYTDILKLAAGSLDSEGAYLEILNSGDSVPPAGDHLVVTDAWILLARSRSNNYLFEDLLRLQGKLASGCEIPEGPAALVTEPSDKPVQFGAISFRGLSGRGESVAGVPARELYFPLPYNDEQVTIVQNLEQAPGVCVQGPPGTGKTHTIANIICHYLATGRRVLVTSRGERALEVLQEKIPDGVRPLTVALLSGDREGVRQFQASIEAIQHQVSQINAPLLAEQIETARSAIDRAHAELARLDTRVDEIAMAQLADIEVDGVPMRAQKLAELVVAGAFRYGWFDDAVTLSSRYAPPLTEEQAGQLRAARRRLGVDLVYVTATVPSADDLPVPAAIAELHTILTTIRTIESQTAKGELLQLKALTAPALDSAWELLVLVEEAVELTQEVESVEGGWALALRAKCRQASFASERAALEVLFSELDELIEARAAFLQRPVDFPETGLSSAKTREAVARAARTGKPFSLLSMPSADTKWHIGAVRVSGLPPGEPQDWKHVARFLQMLDQIGTFVTRWNTLQAELGLPGLDGSFETLRRIEVTANLARSAHKLATRYDTVLVKKAQAVFERPPTQELLGSSEQLLRVRMHLQRQLHREELAKGAVQLTTLQEKLANKTGPASDRLRAFIADELGDPRRAAERVAARYAELLAELRRIAALSAECSAVRDVAAVLAGAGAPKLAARVRNEPVSASGEDRTFPPDWRAAWNWARMRVHLEGIEAREELVSISRRRADLERGLANLYQDMVAKAAWLATKKRSTPKILQALAGYAIAIRRIGQGTGPNATRYRRDARDAMLDAAGAVPCWIMNHARISEAMPADIGSFDLVIVDEASQSDLWALPAILRGARILVVGDDKQVSPDAGFIPAQHLQALRQRFLQDQPYGAEMTPEKSLYDLALRVFAAGQVMLREHFRCVPPIIAYSNRVFYKGGIHPIRIPKPSERLDPPLVDIYVPEGVRDRRDRNDLEAQAIAAEVTALIENPGFDGRSVGVVSLLGTEQAKHIDKLVRQRVDAAELHRRDFYCGEPREFQGAERDIMFLSMVVDPSDCKALSGSMFDQRFNVAASRARDRMYLIRSVKASELSEKDLRMTLLAHFDKPLVADREEMEVLVDRCESGFEKQVYRELTARGYKVTPQVKTGAYRIDLVVEGEGDARLAVECDGDEFHGPDRWAQDMRRQRVLERAGWTFWRCFASTWMLHKDEVLLELLERLNSMGIAPVGALELAPTIVEKRTWSRPDVRDDAAQVLENAIGLAAPG